VIDRATSFYTTKYVHQISDRPPRAQKTKAAKTPQALGT
jgi:hypothetical protein